MATKQFCDKCKKEIVEKVYSLHLAKPFLVVGEQIEEKSYDLCKNCFLILKAKLAEYLP